jgi:hypothetical protein
MPLAEKVMLTMFRDSHGVLIAHFQKCGENVNSASYCEVFLRLWDAILRKLQANWQEGHCFIMTVPDPIQPEQPGKDSRVRVGTSSRSALQPGVGL